jgi:hypothetical protein
VKKFIRPSVYLAVLLLCSDFCALAQTWTLTTAPVGYWGGVASAADGGKIIVLKGDPTGQAGRIYCSTNSGASWFLTSAPYTNWSSISCSADGVTSVGVCCCGGPIVLSIPPRIQALAGHRIHYRLPAGS